MEKAIGTGILLGAFALVVFVIGSSIWNVTSPETKYTVRQLYPGNR